MPGLIINGLRYTADITQASTFKSRFHALEAIAELDGCRFGSSVSHSLNIRGDEAIIIIHSFKNLFFADNVSSSWSSQLNNPRTETRTKLPVPQQYHLILTLGQVHRFSVMYEGSEILIDKDCVVKIPAKDHAEGREIAFKLFGAKWAFSHDENMFDERGDIKYYPRGKILLIPEFVEKVTRLVEVGED